MQYHVYLPPVTLTPLDKIDTASPPVTFHIVPVPSLSSADRRPAITNDAGSAQPGPSQLRPSNKHQWHSQPAGTPIDGEDGQRRSKRLRTSASFLGTLPQMDSTESFLSSLNTTVSLSGASVPSSSLVNVPKWSLPLAKLTPLPQLLAPSERLRTRTFRERPDERRRVSVLCCIMSVNAPVCRNRRKSRVGTRGFELWMSSWRVSVPPLRGSTSSDPVSCDVKLWEECARDWGGMVRKGDIVLLEDIEFCPTSNEGPRLVISPNAGHTPPVPVILYRTLPRYSAAQGDYVYRAGARGAVEPGQRGDMNAEDRALRPDLRLARSDPGLRRVAELAKWCAEWIGGEPPPM